MINSVPKNKGITRTISFLLLINVKTLPTIVLLFSLPTTSNMRGGNGTDHNQNYAIIKYPRGFLQKYHEEIAEYTSDNV